MKTYSQSQSKPTNKRPFILAAGALVTILLVLFATERLNVTNFFDKPAPQASQQTAPAGTVDYGPPSEADQQVAEDHKEDLINPETPPPINSGEKRQVTPLITYADQTEVNAFVPGIYESGGTCTLTLSKGDIKTTKEAQAIKDATTTRCPNFILTSSDFSSTGSWSATVSYGSPTAQGTSSAQVFEVK